MRDCSCLQGYPFYCAHQCYFKLRRLAGTTSWYFLRCPPSKSVSSSLSTDTSCVCQIPCWLLLLSTSNACLFDLSSGISDSEPMGLMALWEGLEESLKPTPELGFPVSEWEDLDSKVLRKNGRRVGIHAATMTTFCSTLEGNQQKYITWTVKYSQSPEHKRNNIEHYPGISKSHARHPNPEAKKLTRICPISKEMQISSLDNSNNSGEQRQSHHNANPQLGRKPHLQIPKSANRHNSQNNVRKCRICADPVWVVIEDLRAPTCSLHRGVPEGGCRCALEKYDKNWD